MIIDLIHWNMRKDSNNTILYSDCIKIDFPKQKINRSNILSRRIHDKYLHIYRENSQIHPFIFSLNLRDHAKPLQHPIQIHTTFPPPVV